MSNLQGLIDLSMTASPNPALRVSEPNISILPTAKVIRASHFISTFAMWPLIDMFCRLTPTAWNTGLASHPLMEIDMLNYYWRLIC